MVWKNLLIGIKMNYTLKHRLRLLLIKIRLWSLCEPIYEILNKKYRQMDTRDFATTPTIVAEFLKDIIQDKVVCDIGCRKGYLMLDFAKYAKGVIGIDNDENCLKICRKKGLNVIKGDFETMEMPGADVYYIWSKNKFVERIVNDLRKRGQKGIVIIKILPHEPLIYDDFVFNIPYRKWGYTEEIKIQIVKL